MSQDLGILIIRLVFGAAMAAHGTQKLFGWFGGHGLEATGGFFERLGFRPGIRFAAAAGLSETGGGVLLALGLLNAFRIGWRSRLHDRGDLQRPCEERICRDWKRNRIALSVRGQRVRIGILRSRKVFARHTVRSVVPG